MAQIDLPTNIEYILQYTNASTLTFAFTVSNRT
jgi:hypothetical protein